MNYMFLYKVVARFGLDSELDSMLFWKKTEAIKTAKLWLEQEDCDEVCIYYEETDASGCYRTKGYPTIIKREGE